jgi:hypothetical protein
MEGERIVLLMDVNKHPTDSKFVRRLTAKNPDMSESSHKYWGPTLPYSHVNGTYLIGGSYMSPEIEVVNLAMLNFTNNPGDHRLLILNTSIRSLFGEFRYTVCRPVCGCLVTSQPGSVNRYNQILWEQYDVHQIKERLDAVDKMMWYCEYPSS